MMTPDMIALIVMALCTLVGGFLAYRFNAEFRRCVWLEFSFSRLAAMTIVLLAFFLLAFVVVEDGKRYVLTVAVVMFFLIPGLWAIFRAAYAVPEEIHIGTWDAQRLSGIGAWNLTWGKLLGATGFMWYGGLICVAAAIWAAPDFKTAVFDWSLRIGCVLGGQAVALCVALAQIRKNRTSRNVRYPFMAGQLTMLLVARLVGVMSVLQDTSIGRVRLPNFQMLLSALWSRDLGMSWYGVPVESPAFKLMTVGGLVALGLFGAWRLMRIELRYHVVPWAWPLFNLLALAYVFGFIMPYLGHFMAPILPLALASVPVLVVLTYIGAFSEPKDFMRYRWAVMRLRARNWRGAWELLPLWLPSLALLLPAIALSIWALLNVPLLFCPLADVSPSLQECPYISRIISYYDDPEAFIAQWIAFLLALLLFMLRDLCLILFLNMSRNPKQADLIAWLYMVLSYIVAPVIFGALQYEITLPLFIPLPIMPAWVTLPAALPGLIIAAGLLAWRWRSRQKRQVADAKVAA